MVFSAGYNPRLYNYIEQFRDFFPDENGEYRMEGQNLRNADSFRARGYRVVPVEDRSYENYGNIHFISNVLAQNPDMSGGGLEAACPLT